MLGHVSGEAAVGADRDEDVALAAQRRRGAGGHVDPHPGFTVEHARRVVGDRVEGANERCSVVLEGLPEPGDGALQSLEVGAEAEVASSTEGAQPLVDARRDQVDGARRRPEGGVQIQQTRAFGGRCVEAVLAGLRRGHGAGPRRGARASWRWGSEVGAPARGDANSRDRAIYRPGGVYDLRATARDASPFGRPMAQIRLPWHRLAAPPRSPSPSPWRPSPPPARGGACAPISLPVRRSRRLASGSFEAR